MTISARLEHDGLHIELPDALQTWASSSTETLLPVAAQMLTDCEAVGISTDQSAFKIPAALIAAWPERLASLLKIPPALPFPLDLRLSAGLGKPGTTISYRWLRVGTSLALSSPVDVKGLTAAYKDQKFRVTNPYWTVLQLVDDFNRLSDRPDAQFEAWAAIRKVLGDQLTEKLPDTFLRSLRVISADSFTLNFARDATGNPDIVPRLMLKNSDPTGDSRPGGSSIASGELALLPDDDAVFLNRLDGLADGQTVFPLRDGTFIAVTPELARQLSAVKQVRRASPAERRQMVLNPSGVLREILDGQNADSVPLDLIETDKYSERVTTLAAWVPPIVPWVKIPPIDWKGPTKTKVGFRIGDKEVDLTSQEVGEAISSVEKAIAHGKPTVEIAKGISVPATAATLTSLRKLEKALVDPPSAGDLGGPTEAAESLVLVIETNFENEDFNRTKVGKRPGQPGLPYSLSTKPKEHQETGIRWLQEHWLSGSTGCLLADDMGLGKTYQALAFLAWIKEQMNDGRVPSKPLLVVAPVGLLANWEKEQEMHLRHEGIGAPLKAYGPYLNFLKRGSQRDGTATLDTLEIAQAPWVLTNYEAVSEYQLSFGAISFGTVIFDEAQKIKSPATAMTSAAKAVAANANFVIAMTGTPVENRLADLWCITDTCQPFSLGDIKSFSQRFESDPQPESLKTLREKLWQKEELVGRVEPQIMLRRLKSEKLKGLPQKHEHVLRKNMPARQANAYRQATALNDIRGPQGTLGLIQSLRQISLHPGLFDSDGFDPNDSARFLAMIEILDQIKNRGEKALVFVESLEIQSTSELPLLLQRRYNLPDLPMVINGAVGTAKRQQRVDAFQSGSDGFDVMLLSPKAGGVGLTLTAANHVIHLSRWWNPAVEDQCSDRAYRIGQTRDVNIYYPIAIDPEDPDHSFDLKLNELMERKRNLSRTMLMPTEFGKEDYETLISEVFTKRQ